MLGSTKKTANNLDLWPVLPEKLAEYIAYAAEVCANQPWGDNFVSLTLTPQSTVAAPFGEEESIWFLQAAGAITLMLRGRFKSLLGKQLEGATLVTMLRLLGLKNSGHQDKPATAGFALNVELTAVGSRETDAVVYAPPTSQYPGGMIINIDMGLIGAGNQEVTQDKLNRVGTFGVVIVDKLGLKSKVPAAAISQKVALIQLRRSHSAAPEPEPLQDLHLHLSRFFPSGTLVAPQSNGQRGHGIVPPRYGCRPVQ